MLKDEIKGLANRYAKELDAKTKNRIKEMETDDKSHYLIYKVLGVTGSEGDQIDIYQNKGRFLYKYAGSFLEEAVLLCFIKKFPKAECNKRINNPNPGRPKKFEIDCLINSQAYEVKWRDATTDGDHIVKEHSRVKAIKKAGYCPVRLMFYAPNRKQAIRIQDALKTIYIGLKGKYIIGDAAWNHVKEVTGIDLFRILTEVANERH